jgi:hypothetical protein
MKYLKKYNMFLEAGLDILPTDEPDVKASKGQMELVTKQLADFKTKKPQIDTLYKTIKDPTQIASGLTKILGVDVKSRNPFLVDYVSISKMNKDVDDMQKENVLDKVRLDDFQRDLKITTDPNLKQSLTTKIGEITKRMNDRVTNINKIQNDFLLADKAQKEKMLKVEKDIKDNITKISNVDQK